MGRGPKTDEDTLSPGCDAAFDVHHGHTLNCLTSPSAYHDFHGSGRSWTCHGRRREALSKYITPVPQVSMYMPIGCREVCVSMANIQNGRHTSRQFCQPIVKRQLAYRLSEPRGHDPFERIYRLQKRHGWPSSTLSLWFRLLAWSRIRSDLQTYLDHSPAATTLHRRDPKMYWEALLALSAVARAAPPTPILETRQGGVTMLRFGCTQLVVDRIDPLVNPGQAPTGHIHQIVGGNAFNITMPTDDVSEHATCTSCLPADDFSNYWTANLYFQHKNGSFKRVPQGGSA